MKYFHFFFLLLLYADSLYASSHLIVADVEFPTESGSEIVKDVTLTVIGDKVFFEGDIHVGYLDSSGNVVARRPVPHSSDIGIQNVVVSPHRLRWPHAVVPYSIAPLFDNMYETRNAILRAMDAISSESGVRFVPRNGHKNFIEFIPNPDDFCSSRVGMVGGKQTIDLAEYCQENTDTHVGIIIHELLHALGFYHTHSRSDRDNYIIVHLANIKPEHRHNFRKFGLNDSSVSNFGPYDLRSVMHYRRFTTSDKFVYDVTEPMLSVIGSASAVTGNERLSANDIKSLRAVYGALVAPSLSSASYYCAGATSLYWDPIPGASYYLIEQSATHSWYRLTRTNNTLAVINLNDSRYIRVKACNANDECSLPSNVEYIPIHHHCV